MISRTVKVQLVVFTVLAVLALLITGINYVGLDKKIFKPYEVKAYFVNSGNIFTNAEVTYRGVTVGRVGKLDIARQGVVATLEIDRENNKIPAQTRAEVQKLSAVGEQYVDLSPVTNSGPYLKNKSVIPYAMTSTPVDENSVLIHANDLVRTVPKEDLVTTVNELDNAFSGLGPDLQRLIDRGNEVIRAVQSNVPQTQRLIEESRVVLKTQTDVGPEFISFSHDIADVSATLRSSDPDLRRLLDNGVVFSRDLQGLLNDVRPDLPVFLGNLITLGQIQAARLPGLDQILVLYPKVVDGGFAATSNTAAGARFGLVTDQSPTVCTQGYLPKSQQDQIPSPGKSETAANKKAAPLNVGCTAPINSDTDIRGSRNAPRPAGDKTDPALGGYDYGNASTTGSGTSGGSTSSTTTTASAATAGSGSSSNSLTDRAAFDPGSGLVTAPDGRQYFLGADGGQAAVLGSDSWKNVLLAPLTS